MHLDPNGLEAACKAYDAVAATNPQVAYAVSVGMKRAIRAYLLAAPSPSPAPGVVEALREAAETLEWASHRMKGNCSGPDVNAVILAASRARKAAAELDYVRSALAASPAAQVAEAGVEDHPRDTNSVVYHNPPSVIDNATPANPAQGVSGQDVRTACEWLANHVGNISLRDWDPCANVLLQAADRLDELTAAIGAGGAVKPLKWTKAALDGKFGWLIIRYAQTPFGRYYVEKFGSENYRVSLSEQVLTSILPSSVDEGIAAAQADYERRILSALSQPHPADERVVEALERIRDLTPADANARSAQDLYLSVKAIAVTALTKEGRKNG